MKTSQKRAIWYAIQKKREERRESFIIEKEGSLEGFRKSRYKTMYRYIIANYGVRIY